MPDHVRFRLVTLALVFAGCAAAFFFWKDSAPIPAGVALVGAAAAEIAFWIRVWQRVG